MTDKEQSCAAWIKANARHPDNCQEYDVIFVDVVEALLADIGATLSKMKDDHHALVIANKEYRDILKARIAELEAQQQWVSVDERLPLEGQDVYLWYPTLPAMIRHFWAEDTTITDVTHWRDNTPPAPPQEDTP